MDELDSILSILGDNIDYMSWEAIVTFLEETSYSFSKLSEDAKKVYLLSLLKRKESKETK